MIPKLFIAAAVSFGLAGPSMVLAQSYPTKPVRMIVPFPPGGGTDAFARPLSKALSNSMGQPFVIDNRGVKRHPPLRVKATPTFARCRFGMRFRSFALRGPVRDRAAGSCAP